MQSLVEPENRMYRQPDAAVPSATARLANRLDPQLERLVVTLNRTDDVRPKLIAVSRCEQTQIEILRLGEDLASSRSTSRLRGSLLSTRS